MKESGGMVKDPLDGTDNMEDAVINGRVFEKGDRIYDLVEVVEEGGSRVSQAGTVSADLEERLMGEIRAIAERMARELIPAIAERIIREEIEKLKRG